MKETLIIAGGIFTVALIIFHLLFWRIFKWPGTLRSLNPINRATMQVLNISITIIFFIIAYISFVHTNELLSTKLGNTLLVSLSGLWLFRAVQQIAFYKLNQKASIGLTFYFLIGALLYGLPLLI
jgi:hypothetical protein